MKSQELNDSSTQQLDESQLAKQVDAAILSEDNNFIVQTLLSTNAQIAKVAHSRVHTFCQMNSMPCYS
jgi:hypothetical protein